MNIFLPFVLPLHTHIATAFPVLQSHKGAAVVSIIVVTVVLIIIFITIIIVIKYVNDIRRK